MPYDSNIGLWFEWVRDPVTGETVRDFTVYGQVDDRFGTDDDGNLVQIRAKAGGPLLATPLPVVVGINRATLQ